MTPQERIAKAERAQRFWDEFIGLQVEDMIGEYTARIVEHANTELNSDKRRDKITALSHAIRITENIREGLLATITDGELARKDKLRAENIENMTAPQRRLLGVVPY